MANTSILSAFERMWQHVKAVLGTKSDIDHTHNYAGSETEGGVANSAYVKEPVTTEGTGSAYTATVPGITELKKGVSFVMVPHTVSTSASPTLNVNGLGAKGIRRRLSNISTTVQSGYSANWLGNGQPFTVTYNGTCWIVEGNIKTAAVDLYGTLGVAKGGTGATTLTANAVLTGNGTSAVKNVATASGALYATEANGAPQFGTLPIAQGGTSATTEEDARTNLGLTSDAIKMAHVYFNSYRYASDSYGTEYISTQALIHANVEMNTIFKTFRVFGSLYIDKADEERYEILTGNDIWAFLYNTDDSTTSYDIVYDSVIGHWWGNTTVGNSIHGGTNINYSTGGYHFTRDHTLENGNGGWSFPYFKNNFLEQTVFFELTGKYNI